MSEAATVLGVTVDAVRGRVRRGKLDADHEGSTVYVWVDAEEADRLRQSEAGQGPSQTVEGPSDDSRLVEVLKDQVEHLRAQIAAEREVNRENRRLLAAALERIPAIEATRESRAEPETVPDAPEGTEPPPGMVGTQTSAEEPVGEEDTVRRPWWLRWLGG